MLEGTHEHEEIIQRVAALDVGKAEVVCCVRVPGPDKPGRRLQEISMYSTMTRSLLALSDRLRGLGVTRVVMEATSDYWKPVFSLLEADGREVWLVNARDVKHLPGRPKTDKLDAVWLCKGRRTADDPPEFRATTSDPQVTGPHPIPDRSGQRAHRGEKPGGEAAGGCLHQTLGGRVRHLRRVGSGHAGRPDQRAARPQAPAQLARTRMRPKIGQWGEAFTGHFTDHHAFLLTRMLGRVDAIDTDIAAIEAKIAEVITPFVTAVAQLDEIPGVGVTAACVIIAEVGVDMSRFPTPGHLASWARFAPGVKESAGRKKGAGSTGHGNPYLARVLGEAAVTAGKTDTFLGKRYRRIATRRGKKKAIVAVGRSILVIAWHLLSNPEAHFHDLGSDFYELRIGPDRKKRNHIRQLEALGYRVTLEPAA